MLPAPRSVRSIFPCNYLRERGPAFVRSNSLSEEGEMIRIANGQGFWGDWLEAPLRLVKDGPLDYLTLDYLAEVTMSILQKLRKTDPTLGYARDFPPLMQMLAGQIQDKGIRVVANAGGVNP